MFNGAALQLLWTLYLAHERHTQIEHFKRGKKKSHLESARITIEPPNGDVEARGEVWQIKARSDGKPWTLRDFASRVLPELVEVVATKSSLKSYIFVTETEMGDWWPWFQSIREALQRAGEGTRVRAELRKMQPPAEARTLRGALDRTCRGCSALAVVDYLAKRVRYQEGRQTAPKLRILVLRALVCLQVRGGIDKSGLTAEINKALGKLGVVGESELEEVRGALLTRLLDEAAHGPSSVSWRELTQELRPGVISLGDRDNLELRQQEHVRQAVHRLASEFGVPASAIRATTSTFPSQDLSPPGLRGSGRSAFGHEFAAPEEVSREVLLERLGQFLAPQDSSVPPRLAVAVEWELNPQRTLQAAASMFSDSVWGTRAVGPEVLRRAVISAYPSLAGGPWLTVFIDRVKDETEARKRIQEEPWDNHGVRVIYCVRRLDSADSVDASCPELSNADPSTETSATSDTGIASSTGGPKPPAQIASRSGELRSSLQRAPRGSHRQPHELHSLWNQVLSGLPLSGDALISPALRVLEDRTTYPWPARLLRQQGIDDSALTRLKDTGVIAPQRNGRNWELVDPDLGAWLVAEGLATEILEGRRELAALGPAIEECLRPWEGGPLSLSAAPFHLLWLFSDPEWEHEQAVTALLAGLEASDELMQHLVQLGSRVVPHIFLRLRAIADSTSPVAYEYLNVLRRLN